MTEKQVASSDATNITAAITRGSSSSSSSGGSSNGGSGGSYRVHGLKWWTSGAMDPRCKVWWVCQTQRSVSPPAMC